MNTLDALTGPLAQQLYYPAIGTALVVAALAGVLSVFVVLKRLAFIGQGVSHAAFGGVALALLLGLGGATAAGQLGMLAVVLAFSVAAALGIALLSARSRTSPDTAIGIVLALAMAVGFLLYGFAARHAGATGRALPPIESVLFGDLLGVGWADFTLAVVGTVVVLGVLAWNRRAVLFWAFDEPACAAFGVRPHRTGVLMFILLAVAVVVTVKLAGIVLATALFIMPAAAALRLTNKLAPAFVLSTLVSLAGVIVGVVLAFELDWPLGPCVVLALAGLLLIAWLFGRAS